MRNTTGLGEDIRRIRKERGLTQVQLAQRALTTQKSISRIEAGKDNASFLTILSIMDALEMNLYFTDARKKEKEPTIRFD